MSEEQKKPQPGDGLRSLRSTPLFRAVNYELYVKPNKAIMVLGIIAIVGCSGYILYMRNKFENMGYYTAVESDGKMTFRKRESKWTN